MPQPCLTATVEFNRRHIGLMDFVHAASAALWNTRWQVRGYVDAIPEASRDDLEARFVHGSGIHGVNVKRSFLERSWVDDQKELALLALVNVFALYEGWAADIEKLFGDSDAGTELQFPSRLYRSRNRDGVREAIARLVATGSSKAMHNAFAVQLQNHDTHRGPELDELLLVYRYFKECRNCFAHGNGGASPQLLKAYSELSGTTARSLRAKQVPEMVAPVLGDEVVVSLRGVIGFTGIAIQIVRTIDALLAGTKVAERQFLERFQRRHPSRIELPKHGSRRHGRVQALVSQAGYLQPKDTQALDRLLAQNNLVWPA